MTPALRQLYALWHQPGRLIDAAWWDHLGLGHWRPVYAAQPLARAPLDAQLARGLGQSGPVPALSELGALLLADPARTRARCLALGLWVLRSPDYLLLKPYREVLAGGLAAQQAGGSPAGGEAWLDARAQGQLLALLPPDGEPATLTPAALPGVALALGAGWLASTADPAVRVCRLFGPPARYAPPAQPVEPVLRKLMRWL